MLPDTPLVVSGSTSNASLSMTLRNVLPVTAVSTYSMMCASKNQSTYVRSCCTCCFTADLAASCITIPLLVCWAPQVVGCSLQEISAQFFGCIIIHIIIFGKGSVFTQTTKGVAFKLVPCLDKQFLIFGGLSRVECIESAPQKIHHHSWL